ncbi:MAG: hypothetical protein ICV70_04435 [Jiangellaceae bacterium]|nr:hypothetical protein [Jiangellaceae bacterium]
MGGPVPTPTTRWRCTQCGNLTRFDVLRSSRVREYVHLDLNGEPRVEETDVLADTLEQVRCRWCGSVDVELVPRLAAAQQQPGSGPPWPGEPAR